MFLLVTDASSLFCWHIECMHQKLCMHQKVFWNPWRPTYFVYLFYIVLWTCNCASICSVHSSWLKSLLWTMIEDSYAVLPECCAIISVHSHPFYTFVLAFLYFLKEMNASNVFIWTWCICLIKDINFSSAVVIVMHNLLNKPRECFADERIVLHSLEVSRQVFVLLLCLLEVTIPQACLVDSM